MGSDPVLWVPRELNKASDRICNTAMDNRSSRRASNPRLCQYISERWNLKISSDGGCRGGEDKRDGVVYLGGQGGG